MKHARLYGLSTGLLVLGITGLSAQVPKVGQPAQIKPGDPGKLPQVKPADPAKNPNPNPNPKPCGSRRQSGCRAPRKSSGWSAWHSE